MSNILTLCLPNGIMEDDYGRLMERGEEHIKRREEKNNRILKL